MISSSEQQTAADLQSQSAMKQSEKLRDTPQLISQESVLTGHTRCCTEGATTSTFGDHGIQSFANISEVMDTEVTSQIDGDDIELLKVTEKLEHESLTDLTKGQISVQQDHKSIKRTKTEPIELKAKDIEPIRHSILTMVRHLLPEALLNKSGACQHHNGCFENTIRKCSKNFLIGFGIQLLFKNLMLLIKPAKLLRNLKKKSTLQDCTRFGLFLMFFNAAYKLTLCLMRRLFGSTDKVNAPVAGFISAFAMTIDAGHRRELITVLTMSRAIENGINLCEEKGVIPKMQHRDLILWMFANCFIGSCVGLKQGILNKGVLKFYQNWSQMKQNDKLLVNVWHEMLKDGVKGF